MGEYSPAKTGEYPRIFPNFQNCARCVKDLKDNKDNSLHLGRKYARIFVLGHYLFLVAHSFPGATLSENCSLLGTDNVRRQISEHIFAPNGGYCLYIYVASYVGRKREVKQCRQKGLKMLRAWKSTKSLEMRSPRTRKSQRSLR